MLIIVFWGATAGSNGRDPGNYTGHAMDAIAAYARMSPDSASAGGSDSGASSGSTEATITEAEYRDALWMLSLANRDRDRVDEQNARVLGYSEALSRARFTAHMSMGEDLIDELSSNRYFVVLQAYDFPTAVRDKQLKPLWFSRVSVHQQGDFAKAIERMAARASPYYGQPTDGLLRTRNTNVDIGKLRVVDDEAEEPAAAETDPGAPPASP